MGPPPFSEFCGCKYYFCFSASYDISFNLIVELLFLKPCVSKNPERSISEGLGLLMCALALQNNSLMCLNYAEPKYFRNGFTLHLLALD